MNIFNKIREVFAFHPLVKSNDEIKYEGIMRRIKSGQLMGLTEEELDLMDRVNEEQGVVVKSFKFNKLFIDGMSFLCNINDVEVNVTEDGVEQRIVELSEVSYGSGITIKLPMDALDEFFESINTERK